MIFLSKVVSQVVQNVKVCSNLSVLTFAISYSFVQRLLSYYYKDDTQVREDTELQRWIQDIYEHGFFSKASTGEPKH